MRSSRRLTSSYLDWPIALDRAKLEEPPLCVDSIMSRDVLSCHVNDTLNVAAQIMWDHDCGCVPVLDDAEHVVGMVTDRDLCMATYTQGKPLYEIAVGSACSRQAYTCQSGELVADAVRIMERAQVRRLAVVDADEKLIGVISLSDLARHVGFARGDGHCALSAEHVAALLQAVSMPRDKRASVLAPMSPTQKEYLATVDGP